MKNSKLTAFTLLLSGLSFLISAIILIVATFADVDLPFWVVQLAPQVAITSMLIIIAFAVVTSVKNKAAKAKWLVLICVLWWGIWFPSLLALIISATMLFLVIVDRIRK